MNKHANAAGFTLVEVLVVVLIASIVLIVLASVLGSSFEILRTGETRAQLNSNARVALEYVSDDIKSATAIPISFDRDLNGFVDEDPVYGYDEQAYWRVAAWDSSTNTWATNTSYWFSEAWGDRIMLTHDSTVNVSGQNVTNRSFSIPKVLRTRPDLKVVEYNSFFRLAIPASNDMPYYLASEWDRDGDGDIDQVDLRNTGTSNPATQFDGVGEIQGYPDVVSVGPYKETAALIEDLFGYTREPGPVTRIRQIPIASNITRIKFEYLHYVPVYFSRVNGLNVEIAYQDLTDGSIDYVAANDELQSDMQDKVPLVSHWELRPIDVAYNRDYEDSGSGPGSGDTGLTYNGIFWQLQDQYPEGLDFGKLDGTHVTPNTISGLGDGVPAGWGMSVFYTEAEDGENAPIDRLAFVTTSISGGQPVEGGIAELRPDMEAIRGATYYSRSISPTGRGDLGDADGIPDGDGIPDDPVPGWWLPYLRAVRVTIVATPRNIIEERRARSGQVGESGMTVYYRLDSPVPYSDPNRLAPQYNLTQDYIGSGRDVVVTKTVPVDFVYRLELVTDPFSIEPSILRRVEYNYLRSVIEMRADPVNPDEQIRARDQIAKAIEREVNN
jgi:prepilin-type N-terminal cleavage/methylation domain-containing protein